MADARTCPICAQAVAAPEDCTTTALCKLLFDPFEYMVGLRDGTSVLVENADYLAEGWIRLHLKDGTTFREFQCERGVDVRISEIAWVVDAPAGS